MSQIIYHGAKESLPFTTGVYGQTEPFPAFQLEGLEQIFWPKIVESMCHEALHKVTMKRLCRLNDTSEITEQKITQ